MFTNNSKPINPKTPSYRGLFLLVITAIFFAEVTAMVVIYYLDLELYWVETLIDAFIMIVLITPVIYYFHFRTLFGQINERNRVDALLSRLLENLPVGVWIVDKNGDVLQGNPTSQKIWAGSRLVGVENYNEYKAWWLESGKRIESHEWGAARAIQNGEYAMEEEIEIERFDGTRGIILNSAVPILDDDEILGAIVVNQDITSRKKMEQDLRKSEELFRTAVETLPVGIWLADTTGNIIYGNPAGRDIWAGGRYVGIDQFTEYKAWWLESGKPILPEEWGIARAISKGETSINEEIEIECFDTTHKIIMNSAFPLYDEKQVITGAYVINQDITEQKRAAEQLYRQNEELKEISATEKKQRQLAETLAQSIVSLSNTLELDKVLHTLLDHIFLITPSETALVLLFEDEAKDRVQVHRGYGEWQNLAVDSSIPIDGITDSLVQRLKVSRKSFSIPNLQFSPQAEEMEAVRSISSWLVVPIFAGENIIGLVELGMVKAGVVTADQIMGVETLINQASVVIQNAWLFEQVRSSEARLQALAHKLVDVQEMERTHIARELHDEAGQAISSLKIGLSLLEQDPGCPAHIKTRLEDLKRVTDDILDELHSLVMDLRPPTLDHLGLVAALEQYTQALNSEHLTVQFKAIGFDGQHLPNEVAVTFYRIVQEALTNVLRHSAATNVGILLERYEGKVKVFVEDNGIGIQADPLNLNHRLGLVGMRERAEMLGGTLTIESIQGRGTSIIVEVPDGDTRVDRG